jgi:1-acyl-sn-glycerol-3-phosphate acyltransferase
MIITACLLPFRIVLVVLWTLLGLASQISLFWCLHPSHAQGIVKVWARTMLLLLGIRLLTDPQSEHRDQNALYVCNHVSWVDILALLAVVPVVFVAKSEIRSWPVLGWMVALAGTCFIDRARRSALRSVHANLTNALNAKRNICIFPEGTTSSGLQVLPFHSGLLQAAIEAQVPVQPICLNYSHQNAAYIGEITLLHSVWNILSTPRLSVQLKVLPRLTSHNTHRQELAAQAYQSIALAVNTQSVTHHTAN